MHEQKAEISMVVHELILTQHTETSGREISARAATHADMMGREENHSLADASQLTAPDPVDLPYTLAAL